MTNGRRIMLFGLGPEADYAERVARALHVAVSGHEERLFEDGESKCRPTDDVAGADTFVVLSLHGDASRSVHDKLCQLLFFIGTLKDAGANRVAAVVPYLCYARKDQRTQLQDPVTTRYVAALFEAVGTSCVLTFDVHNRAAFENAFRCPTILLSARPLFVEHFREIAAAADTVVMAPDFGGAKRAEEFRRDLASACGREPGMALAEKYRSRGNVSGSLLAGDTRGKTVVIVDDLLCSGKTLRRAAATCRENGAARVFAAVTHVLQGAVLRELLDDPLFDGIAVADTIQTGMQPHPRLHIVDSTRLLAQSIHTAHNGMR